MDKKDIRKQIFQARKETTDAFVEEQSIRICEKIIAMPQFQNASCIYTYMDYNKEASTKLLMEEAWRLGKRIAAPKVFGEHMRYFYLNSFEDVAPGYFGIPEPDESKNLKEAAEEDALLIVPGVAFDADRHRCGYGKGFYDRYLSTHPKHPTIAIALDFQIVDNVPADTFDICPQLLVTPTAVYQAEE